MRRLAQLCLSLVVVVPGSYAVAAEQPPLRLFGNVGYFYTLSEADGGGHSESTQLTGAFNANAYFWQPWFATADAGVTVSASNSSSGSSASDVKLISTRANLDVLPASRYPFRLGFTSSDNVVDWINSSQPLLVDLGQEYRSRYITARQGLMTVGGDRADAWYTKRSWDSDHSTKTSDQTVGLKLRTRAEHQNFYASGTFQERDSSVLSGKSENTILGFTHNYFPTSAFYINTLADGMRIDNSLAEDNGSFRASSVTDVNQVASQFFWRPEYRPFTMTGAVRLQKRSEDSVVASAEQTNFAANLAANVQINRRTRLTATGQVTSLDTNVNNSLATTQSVTALYQSDRILLQEFSYYWYADGGVGNRVAAEYEDTTSSQSVNAGVGHNAQRVWNTGNRSTVRANLAQTARESWETSGLSAPTLNHSGSLSWNENLREGSSYAQFSAMDSRSLEDDSDTQLLNAQFSRNMPIDRVSSWGGNLSAQSSRRNSATYSQKGFLTTLTSRLSYQHGRLFGIYRLKFNTKLDLSSTANRDGGDRKKAEWESRATYAVGMLNTALVVRVVESDSGLGSRVVVFQANRSF